MYCSSREEQRLVQFLMALTDDYVVHVVSQFVSFSTTVHWEAVLLIICYLQSSLHQSLLFSSTFSLDVHAFYNADWAGDVMDCKSPTGLCVFLGDSIFSWKSKSKLLLNVLLMRLNTVLRLQLLQK